MKIRADIANLLHQGIPVYRIAAQLHVGTKTVTATRDALGIAPLRGTQPLDPAQQFYARTAHDGDGHLRWTGYVNAGTPSLTIRNQRVSAAVMAFRLQYDRDPIGNVRPGCGYDGCVAPAHVEDRPMRERFASIFGQVSA
ncbi:hypothetical protein [Streptomyces sp. 35G-GA-8]|uniref:hypothetical protein n=1 Tax=Streptomyces sp. 35G-GA-8 TaxID=2939434 RepID=UPI00201F51B7|nr:hypothetical protein [Streptomyces sp. 35G-GA-8]MCL7377432.1 hypothetical protein [Streptomyces sp. 35G-GA-8]